MELIAYTAEACHLSGRSDAGLLFYLFSADGVNWFFSFSMDYPFRLFLKTLCTRRSRMASARVGSPIISCHLSKVSRLVTIVAREPCRKILISRLFAAYILLYAWSITRLMASSLNSLECFVLWSFPKFLIVSIIKSIRLRQYHRWN